MEEANKAISIVKMLKQVMKTMKHSVQTEFKDMGLTGTQGMLMGILSHNNGMKISDLSKQMGLSNSTVSGIVDRLEKQGFVERVRSNEDRRVVYVSVTYEFKKNIKNNFCKMEKSFEKVMSQVTLEESNKILEGLITLRKVLDRQDM